MPNDALRLREKLVTRIDIGDDIRAYTQPVFQDRIYGNTYTFVPFAVDPYATYISKNHPLSYELGAISRDQVLNNVILGEKEKKLNVPFLFGITDRERALLDERVEVFGGYTDVLSQVLFQWSTGAGISAMQNFFRLQALSGANWWSYS